MLWLHWCETTSVPHSHNSPPFSTGSDEGNTSIFLVCLGFVWYVFLILSAGLPTFLQSASIQQSQTESLQIPSYMDAAKKHVFLMWLLLARNKDHRPWQFSSNPGLKNSGLTLPLENSPLGSCYRAALPHHFCFGHWVLLWRIHKILLPSTAGSWESRNNKMVTLLAKD